MAKHKCPEFENHERWLVSYADMLTLLFAVFVVLFALKEGGEPEVKKAAGAMQESFNTPLEDIPIDQRSGPNNQGFGIFENLQGNQIRRPLSIKYPSPEANERIIEEEMNKFTTKLEERLYGPNKFRKTDKVGNERIVDVQKSEKGFHLKLLAKHFYDSGDVRLKRSSYKQVNEIIELLKPLGRNITIEGHTDSLAPSNSSYSNWEVSTLRATHFVRYMITKHNFPQSRLRAAGYADTKPIAHNGTAAGRLLNRRIEIQVHFD